MRELFNLLRFLLRLSRDIPGSRAMMLGIAGAGVISGLANTGMIALIQSILTGQTSTIARIGWIFAALCVALPLFRLISQTFLIILTQKSLLELRVRLARRVLAAPLRSLEEIGPPRLYAALTNDINQIIQSLVQIPLLIMHLAIVVSCLAYLGWLSWPILLQVLAFIAVGVLTYQLPLRTALGFFTRARQILDGLIAHVRSLTEGSKELKMHRGRRAAFLSDLRETAAALQRQSRVGGIIFAAASSWGQVLFFVAIGLLLLVLPQYQEVSQSVLIGFTLVLFHLMTPLEVLLNNLPTLGQANASAGNIQKLGFALAEATVHDDPTRAVQPSPNWSSLTLDGVEHTYRGENEHERFTLGPLDLTFQPGEIVFLIGGNGSGKTTLAKVILGLYEPEAGRVLLDGEPITDDNRDSYRENFSAVFSDFHLFRRLVGREDVDLEAEAREYLSKLRLEGKLAVEDGSLSTLDLSQGQRKRLALLAAYLEDRPIYLFDEWAADQDPVFKETFYLDLLPELKRRGKTLFVISHDDHYFHVADRVIKLDYGAVEYDRKNPELLDAAADAAGSKSSAAGSHAGNLEPA